MPKPLAEQAARRRGAIEAGEFPARFAVALARKDVDLVAAAVDRRQRCPAGRGVSSGQIAEELPGFCLAELLRAGAGLAAVAPGSGPAGERAIPRDRRAVGAGCPCPDEGMEDLMWRRLVLAAALAVTVPASIVVAAAPASASVPPCGALTATAHWSTQQSYSYFPGHWCATDGYQEVVWQSDGNLVWYKISDGHVFWASGTDNSGAAGLSFQVDGNIVIYTSRGHVLWADGNSSRRTASTQFYWSLKREPSSVLCTGQQTRWILDHYQTNPDVDPLQPKRIHCY
jgi:hypothetical protein